MFLPFFIVFSDLGRFCFREKHLGGWKKSLSGYFVPPRTSVPLRLGKSGEVRCVQGSAPGSDNDPNESRYEQPCCTNNGAVDRYQNTREGKIIERPAIGVSSIPNQHKTLLKIGYPSPIGSLGDWVMHCSALTSTTLHGKPPSF